MKKTGVNKKQERKAFQVGETLPNYHVSVIVLNQQLGKGSNKLSSITDKHLSRVQHYAEHLFCGGRLTNITHHAQTANY